MKPTIWRVRKINKGGREEKERRNRKKRWSKEGKFSYIKTRYEKIRNRNVQSGQGKGRK